MMNWKAISQKFLVIFSTLEKQSYFAKCKGLHSYVSSSITFTSERKKAIKLLIYSIIS